MISPLWQILDYENLSSSQMKFCQKECQEKLTPKNIGSQKFGRKIIINSWYIADMYKCRQD